jgi:4-hydroxy-4-methyl-2-oxoglutarate aldolase
VVGDVLDAAGRYHQFLPAGVQPIRETMKVVGRAMPVLMIDVHGPQKKPFGLLTEALDSLREGEVYLASGGGMRCAYWGELLTATACVRGAVGAVVDGYHRDTPQVLAQNWPVFSRGRFAQDSAVRTQVANFRCPIEIDGTWIEPGDLVFGDMDGVVIVPRALEAEIIAQALKKARGEKVVRRAIEEGMSATAAFKKFGIL